MDVSHRPVPGGPYPGAEAAGLWLITAAVVAGLIVTGVTVVARAVPGPADAKLVSHARGALVWPRLAGGAAEAGGLRLLGRAARACWTVPFQGTESLAWGGPAGPSTSVVDVWHARDARPVMRAVSQPPDGPAGIHRFALPWNPDVVQGLDASGMLGLSSRMVRLLRANYRLAAGGWGRVAGRPARLVTVSRRGGGLAARLWLDAATYLPLRRQVLGPAGHPVSDVAFTQLRLGPAAVATLPGAAAQPWGHILTAPQLARLRGQGWLLPGPLPGHLALLGARQAVTRVGPVIDLDYSDGLSVVSVFVQRGHLPTGMAGWAETAQFGRRVYTDDSGGHSVAWSAGGYVYTLVAEAPPQTVARVISALPHNAPPGLLARLQRGLRRLLSWLP